MRDKINDIIYSAILQSISNPNNRSYFCKNATEEIIKEFKGSCLPFGMIQGMFIKLHKEGYLNTNEFDYSMKVVDEIEDTIEKILS